MVCPLCRGKSEVGVFCYGCYLKQNLKIEMPSTIDVLRCRGCGTYILGQKRIISDNEEELVRKVAQESLKTNMKGLDKAGVLRFDVQHLEKEYRVSAVVTLGDAERVAQSIVRIRNTSCQDCSRLAGGYYEAILQIRGGASKRMVDDIVGKIEGYKDKYAFITKIEKVAGGFDIYVGGKKAAEKIVRLYHGEAEIKKSFQQVSYDKQRGKDKHRFFYLIRV